MGLAAVTVQESVCAEEYSAVAIVKSRGHNAVVQGGRVDKYIEATDKAEQSTDSEAEAVEEREAIENTIIILEIGDGEHLPNIGEDIAMSEFDTLGHALRAAGEKN